MSRTHPVDSVPRAISGLRQITIRIQIERHNADEILAHINAIKPNPRALPGDTRRLRGIPAIGLGVQGAIPGTRPDIAIR